MLILNSQFRIDWLLVMMLIIAMCALAAGAPNAAIVSENKNKTRRLK
jgi:hypothetical protein